jgi:DNA repair exonuclease SbcCD ATPase subunit
MNGYGKTSILEALYLGLYGKEAVEHLGRAASRTMSATESSLSGHCTAPPFGRVASLCGSRFKSTRQRRRASKSPANGSSRGQGIGRGKMRSSSIQSEMAYWTCSARREATGNAGPAVHPGSHCPVLLLRW